MAAGGSISSLLETWRRADEGFSAPRSPPAASAGASSGRRRTLFAESRQAEAEPLAAGDTALHSLRLQIGRLLSDAKQREVEMETLRTRLSSEAERDASQEVDRLHHEAAGVRRALQRRTRARAYCRFACRRRSPACRAPSTARAHLAAEHLAAEQRTCRTRRRRVRWPPLRAP